MKYCIVFVVVPLLSCVQLFVTPWTAACQASLSFTISWGLLKLMFIESVMPFNHLILCQSLLLCPQSFPASGSFPVSRLFASGGQSIGALDLESILPMNIQGLFSLVLTGLISLLSKGLSRVFQHQNSKASILCHSAFFMVELSHPYMTTGKTIVLTIWTFVRKEMSLLFNRLFRFVIAFLPTSKRRLISWLQSRSTCYSLWY